MVGFAKPGHRLSQQGTDMCSMRKYIEKCEAAVANAHGQIATLKAEGRAAREEASMHKERAAAVRAEAEAEASQRLQLALQQQKLALQERMQVFGISTMGHRNNAWGLIGHAFKVGYHLCATHSLLCISLFSITDCCLSLADTGDGCQATGAGKRAPQGTRIPTPEPCPGPAPGRPCREPRPLPGP